MSKEKFQEKPKICLIDVESSIVEELKSAGFNTATGSLGTIVDILPSPRKSVHCLANHSFPTNLHEYDIFVVDLKERIHTSYIPENHQRNQIKTPEAHYFLCEYPQNTFDPISIGSIVLGGLIDELENKPFIIIMFCTPFEETTYKTITIGASNYHHDRSDLKVNNYSFLPFKTTSKNKMGLETQIERADTDFGQFLKKYNEQLHYHIVFTHPTYFDREIQQSVKTQNFIPLIRNSAEDIVGYLHWKDKGIIFAFPQMEDKKSFILELFQSALPSTLPEFFPYNDLFSWLRREEYWLPNEQTLREEKAEIQQEFEIKLKESDEKISQNYEVFRYLHDLIVATDNELVNAVQKFLEWLEFEQVINVDELNERQREEDLRIPFDGGLIVIEVKGIGRTSTDDECSQINKIRRRREKERNRLDVHALYIVNHQRFLPPLSRQNPPFQAHQITDAENDERGLLTAYQLFKLYFAINEGFITKSDARKTFLQTGLIDFEPSNAKNIGCPKERHHRGTVGVFHIDNVPIKLESDAIIHTDGNYKSVQIIGLMIDNVAVDKVSSGEVGIKFSSRITNDSEIWILDNNE